MSEFKQRYIDLLVDRLGELDCQLEGDELSGDAIAKAKAERLSVAKEMHSLSDAPLKSARDQIAAGTTRILTSLAVGNGAGATVVIAALLRIDSGGLGRDAVWAAAWFVSGGVLVSALPIFNMFVAARLLRLKSSAARSSGNLVTYLIAGMSFACFLTGAAALAASVMDSRVPEGVPKAPTDGRLLLISKAAHIVADFHAVHLGPVGRSSDLCV